MSATEELRRMLDERGVKWWPKHDIENGYCEDRDTEFLVYGCKHVAHEWGHRLNVDMLTPAQAVEATLGREECEDIGTDRFVCSKCGCTLDIEDAASCEPTMWMDGVAACPRFCPNCGRKVKQ